VERYDGHAASVSSPCTKPPMLLKTTARSSSFRAIFVNVAADVATSSLRSRIISGPEKKKPLQVGSGENPTTTLMMSGQP
jgi:hypothetical protein